MKNSTKALILILVVGAIFVWAKDRDINQAQEPKLIIVDKQAPVRNTQSYDLGYALDHSINENPSAKMNSQIPVIVEWDGVDPYPSVDWSEAVPELKTAVENFEKEWGKPLHIRQVYRPLLYSKHIRSVWEVWRYINGKSYTVGYGCEDAEHIDPSLIGELTQAQKAYLDSEVAKHSFLGGDTPPGCVSDHAKGIAIDITPPFDPTEYERFINVANSVGLCHYIAGDEPHFGLTAYLAEGIDCFVK